MLPAIIVLGALFALLLLLRLGAARRALLAVQWPAVLAGAGAAVALARGKLWLALALAGAAAAAWFLTPILARRASSKPDRGEAEARMALGLAAGASEADIRRAYRDKIARAHPDRGGATDEAQRLTAARDLLLKRRR